MVKTTNRYTLVTIVNYGFYQSSREKTTNNRPSNDHQTTNNRPSNDHQTTNNRPQYNKDNNNNKDNKNNRLNKIKLNSLYLFINKKNKNFEGLNETDRISIETTLKKLELYIENDKSLPEQMKFDLQLKYYAIAQIYLSPYKIYLTDLKEKLFTRIFLAAKKYCPITIDDENRLEDFMNYFIVCFRNELEKKNG